MIRVTLGIAVLTTATWCSLGRADEMVSPRVEKYLHTGAYTVGEQALETALADAPTDDQLRFGLGVLRFVHGVERLGQSLYEYGVEPEKAGNSLFLRLPVPKNPEPNTIRYTNFRRILDDFRRDLSSAEETLAGVTHEDVKLPLRLAKIRLDFTGNGKSKERFVDVLKKLMPRQNLTFLKGNSDFLVCFDRGDVAWLRAYCHFLMGAVDFYLAFDTEPIFNEWIGQVFADPKYSHSSKKADDSLVFTVLEPVRLRRFRKHILKMCELNRETWRYIRAETDDDHEWLPNPRQTGVLGLPVRDEMIDAWLGAVGEVEAALRGKKLLPNYFGTGQKGIDLREVLNNPPEKFDLGKVLSNGVSDKYLKEGELVDTAALLRVSQAFGALFMGYAAWFN